MERFKYNPEGYKEAMEFLKEHESPVATYGLDGWSLIYEANAIWLRIDRERKIALLERNNTPYISIDRGIAVDLDDIPDHLMGEFIGTGVNKIQR